jgi:hypothetical protein
MFLQAEGSKIINGMYVRIESDITSQDFRFWATLDYKNSASPHPVRATSLLIPESGITLWNDFRILDRQNRSAIAWKT